MSEDQISNISHHAFDYAWQMSKQPQNASLDIIPIVVRLTVFTVQQVGESFDACMERAFKPECLVPLYLYPLLGVEPPQKLRSQFAAAEAIDLDESERCRLLSGDMLIWHALFRIRGSCIRVENDDQARDLEPCPICLREAAVGALVATLPCCFYFAFLAHCLLRWSEDNNLCPCCNSKTYELL